MFKLSNVTADTLWFMVELLVPQNNVGIPEFLYLDYDLDHQENVPDCYLA